MTLLTRPAIVICMQMILGHATAQNEINFGPFIGEISAIPLKELEKGYGIHVLDNEKLADVTYDSLYFPEQLARENFPGIQKKSGFGMVLYSDVSVSKNGCYEFTISSDDGSIFWINNQRIIDIDGPHPMRTETDTVYLETGKYRSRFWYHNAYPTRRGLLFNYRHVKIDSCKYLRKEELVQNIKASVLFAFDDAQLLPHGVDYLDSIVGILQKTDNFSYLVIGHTDNVGSNSYNQILSQERADTVKEFLDEKLPLFTFEAKGMGASKPLYKNSTRQNREKNRRVEIIALH